MAILFLNGTMIGGNGGHYHNWCAVEIGWSYRRGRRDGTTSGWRRHEWE
jgi:hypothetical protein